MMPLTMVKTGEENTIKKVGGKEENQKIFRKSRICNRRRCYGCI